MGVPNGDKYELTKHAKDRIIERFNILPGETSMWMRRLMSGAKLDEKQADHRERYRNNDILLILDTRAKSVISVYPRDRDYTEIKTNPVNPELQSFINDAVHKYKLKRENELAVNIKDAVDTLYTVIGGMQNTSRYLEKQYDEAVEAFDSIANEFEKTKDFIKEADAK